MSAVVDVCIICVVVHCCGVAWSDWSFTEKSVMQTGHVSLILSTTCQIRLTLSKIFIFHAVTMRTKTQKEFSNHQAVVHDLML